MSLVENQVFAPGLSLCITISSCSSKTRVATVLSPDRPCCLPRLSLSPQWSSHLCVGPLTRPQCPCPNQPELRALRETRARLLGAGLRAPSRSRHAVTCNTRCHAPVTPCRENCPSQDFCEKFRDGR